MARTQHWLATWLLVVTVAGAAGPGPSGPALIIPQPREMKVLGAAVPLENARIVLTSQEPKLRVGALNVFQMGGKFHSSPSSKSPESRLRILLGSSAFLILASTFM